MQHDLFDLGDAVHAHPSNSEIARVKERHPGMILMFRAGDSYELFDEDAILASRLLGLKLLSSSRAVISFPNDSLQDHLRKLLHAGHRIAVCDAEEPQ